MVFVIISVRIDSSKPCASGAAGVICLFVHYYYGLFFGFCRKIEIQIFSRLSANEYLKWKWTVAARPLMQERMVAEKNQVTLLTIPFRGPIFCFNFRAYFSTLRVSNEILGLQKSLVHHERILNSTCTKPPEEVLW